MTKITILNIRLMKFPIIYNRERENKRKFIKYQMRKYTKHYKPIPTKYKTNTNTKKTYNRISKNMTRTHNNESFETTTKKKHV